MNHERRNSKGGRPISPAFGNGRKDLQPNDGSRPTADVIAFPRKEKMTEAEAMRRILEFASRLPGN